MKDKLFVISIPMQPAEQLRRIKYLFDDKTFSSETSFPGIALLEKYAHGKSPVKIVTVRTDDDNGRSEICYKKFREELQTLSEKAGMDFTIQKEIIVPHNESAEKEKKFLADLFACFEKSGYVYMDVTFGTKISAIEMFSSLCYAEIVKKCNIKSVIYGKYPFDNSDEGEIFDVTRLYHTVRFLETAQHMDKKCFEDLINNMLYE